MSKPRRKTPKDYPRITVRIPQDLLTAVDAFRTKHHQSYGQIVAASLRNHLPKLEAANAILEK